MTNDQVVFFLSDKGGGLLDVNIRPGFPAQLLLRALAQVCEDLRVRATIEEINGARRVVPVSNVPELGDLKAGGNGNG
jgi:hypothetical protein